MDVRSLSKIRNLVGKLDKYCKYSEVIEYTFDVNGEFMAKETKNLDNMDAEENKRYVSDIKNAFRGNLEEKGRLHEYSMYARIRPDEDCNINKLKAVYTQACTDTTLDADAVDKYVRAIAPFIAAKNDERSYIPAKRGIKRFTIHTMALRLRMPVQKNVKTKPAKVENANDQFVPVEEHVRQWLEDTTMIITWVTTVKTVKTSMVCDGTVVEYIGESLPERPVLTVAYPVAAKFESPVSDEDRVLFGTGMKFPIVAQLVRNGFDCDVKASVEQCAERFDNYIEEAVGGVMPLDMKVELLGNLEEHAKGCIGGVPGFTLSANFLDVSLQELGVIKPNSADTAEVTRSKIGQGLMCKGQDYPGAAFLERKHEIVIKDAGVRIQFDGTIPMYQLMRVVDDIDGCSCIQLRLVGDDITLDGSQCTSIPLQRLVELAEFPPEPANLRDTNTYTVDDYTREYYEAERKKEYRPILEPAYFDKDEDGNDIPTAYMKRLYNKYKSRNKPYLTCDYSNYERIIAERTPVRMATIEHCLADVKTETLIRHNRQRPDGSWQPRSNWKTSPIRQRRKCAEFIKKREAALKQEQEQEREFHENMESYGFEKVTTNDGQTVIQAGTPYESMRVHAEYMKKQEEAIAELDRQKAADFERRQRENIAVYHANIEGKGHIVIDSRTGERMNTQFLPENWTYEDDQYLMSPEEYAKCCERIESEKARQRRVEGRRKTAELAEYRRRGELPPAADPTTILPY